MLARLASIIRTILAALAMLPAVEAVPATYPERPMRLIVPFPPGGGVDIVARIIGLELSEGLQQQIVVDNRPGAAGTLGTGLAANASPDGYTMLLGSVGPLTFSPSLYKKLPYDPVKDFAPVSLLVSLPNVLLVNPSSPFKSVKEIIAAARAAPGQLNYASAGAGTPPHLSMELFKSMARLNMVHVPYKGGPPALNDLLGGRVHLMFINILTAVPFIESKKLIAVAVTTSARSPVLPDVPTMAETGGLAGFSANDWFGVLLPAGSPKNAVKKLNIEIVKVLTTTDASKKLRARGAEPVTSTPQEFTSFIKSEIIKWGKVIREAGIPAQ